MTVSADDRFPPGLLYHEQHDWARVDGAEAVLGITWFAQDQLGEIVFIDPPEVGRTLTQGDMYAEIESVKAVSDVVAPLSGEVLAVNDALEATPDALNRDPYGDGWMVRIRLARPQEAEGLMDAAGYRALVEA